MRTITALAFVLALGGAAHAAKSTQAAPHCDTIASLKAAPELKGAKFTPLNIGQFHFIQGVFVATPPLSQPPAADNAVLVQIKGKSLILWMKAECAATNVPPMPIPEPLVGIIRSINPVAGEASDDGWSDDSKDVHL